MNSKEKILRTELCLGGRCSALLSAALYRLFPARGLAIRQPDPALQPLCRFPRDPALYADLVQRPLLLGCSDLPDVGLYPDPQLFSPRLFSGDRFGRSGVRPVCGCRAGVPSCGTAGDAMHGVGGLWGGLTVLYLFVSLLDLLHDGLFTGSPMAGIWIAATGVLPRHHAARVPRRTPCDVLPGRHGWSCCLRCSSA